MNSKKFQNNCHPFQCPPAEIQQFLYSQLANDIECKACPKTCKNWYIPYYGRNNYLPIKFIFNNICR